MKTKSTFIIMMLISLFTLVFTFPCIVVSQDFLPETDLAASSSPETFNQGVMENIWQKFEKTLSCPKLKSALEKMKTTGNINTVTDFNYSLLMLAVYKKEKDLVEYLLSENADVNQADSYGVTPLHLAVLNNDASIVGLLMKRSEIDINKKMQEGITPFMIAAYKGYEGIVKDLINHGRCLLNQKDRYGWSPLMTATQNGHLKIVRELIKHETNIDEKMPNVATALYIAAQNGHREIADVLIAGGANVNQPIDNGATALMIAIQNGRKDVVETLILARADVNQADICEWSPLLIATHQGHHDIIQILLTAGARYPF